MAAPRNVEYYISRIAGYSKNTIKLQPVSQKDPFIPGDVITFRLPTNAIIDLHTLTAQFDLGTNFTGAASNPVLPPRYSECFFRRVDVTAGGVQVGLGSLTDYGSAFSFLAMNTMSKNKHSEMGVLELGGGERMLATDADSGLDYPAGAAATTAVAKITPFPTTVAGGPTAWTFQRVTASMWLGVLGGQYMRFLDTNLYPDIEIRITLARDTVLQLTPGMTDATYSVCLPNLIMETIAFGDNTYESMVEARLSTGEPIVVPFINWASYETSQKVANATAYTGANRADWDGTTGQTTLNQQFTIATQSLNALYGTMRAKDYDSNKTPVQTYFALNDLKPARTLFGGMFQSYYYRFCGYDTQPPLTGSNTSVVHDYPLQPLASGTTSSNGARNTIGKAKYQFTIDSKVYPQFLADVAECYTLTKNSFDGSGGNRDFTHLFGSLKNWYGNAFALGVSLDHNSEDSMRDRLVSGLNTNGSNIPITFTVNGVALPPIDTNTPSLWPASVDGVRPIVFCELTSTVLVYPGRVISVIN